MFSIVLYVQTNSCRWWLWKGGGTLGVTPTVLAASLLSCFVSLFIYLFFLPLDQFFLLQGGKGFLVNAYLFWEIHRYHQKPWCYIVAPEHAAGANKGKQNKYLPHIVKPRSTQSQGDTEHVNTLSRCVCCADFICHCT